MQLTPSAAVILAVLIIWGLFLLMILRERRAVKRKIEHSIKDSWGKMNPRLFFAEDLKHIGKYSESLGQEGIDGLTANDLDLDRVFATIPAPVSSCGDEVLYAWLHHPLEGQAVLSERERLIGFLGRDDEARERILAHLAGLPKRKEHSVYEMLSALGTAEPIGRLRFIFAALLTAASILLLFVLPIPGLVLLIAALILDYRLHSGMKERTESHIKGFRLVSELAAAAAGLSEERAPEIADLTKELRDLGKCFADFRRGRFFLASSGNYGTGLGDALLVYIRLFFHTDLIVYDRMLSLTKEHLPEAFRIAELCGTLDAAASAASLRAARPDWTKPLLSEDAEAILHVQGLRHPLLEHPVGNTLDTKRPVLFTGSNASGKSTFLRSAGLAAIMGQSLLLVPADFYEAPFFRIFSSMAVSDSITEGESYFVAEIRSLARISQAAETEGLPILALVDEILKGTNTVERIAASASLLQMLARKGVLILAATHDLELCSLLNEDYCNLHFEEHMEGDDVCFDYILKEGPARSRNAILLLRKQGFSDAVTERAEQTAAHFEKTGSWELV